MIFVAARSTRVLTRASTHAVCQPTESCRVTRRQVSEVDLSPDHFRRLEPRPVSCYAILRG